MKLIEVTGTPGSGKTTILPIVKSLFKKQGFQVFDKKNIILCGKKFHFIMKHFKNLLDILPFKLSNKILRGLYNYSPLKHQYQIKYLFEHLKFFNDLVASVNSHSLSENHKLMTINWFLNIAASYQIAKKFLGEDTVLLFVEGFVHKVITLFVFIEKKTIDYQGIASYLEQIPPVDILIKVEADENRCKRRIMTRQLPHRLVGRTEDEILQYLLGAKSAIDNSASLLARKGTRVITLNNSGDQFSVEEIKFQLTENLILSGEVEKVGDHNFLGEFFKSVDR